MSTSALAVFLLLGLVAGSFAQQEKNGLRITVAKTTLDRNDRRNGAYFLSDRIDRTQALKVTIKNVSFKDMPEGEVKWKVLVKRYDGSSNEGTMGKETLKALKPAEQVEMIIGAAQIRGWGDSSGRIKDKIEHQVVVMQSSREVGRVESTPAFDTMAKPVEFADANEKKE